MTRTDYILNKIVLKAFIKTVFCLQCILFLCINYTFAQSTSDSITYISTITEGVNAPLRIAGDRSGITYVTDAFSKSISKYDALGNFLESINVDGYPVSVAVNKDGELFIGDGSTGQILKYNETLGASIFYSGTQYPNSMVFSSDNVLYVADSKLQQVVAIDISGNVIQTIGSGTLDFPTGIAFDNNNKRILVGEHGGKGTGFSPVVKVWMFDLQGNLIKSFGSHGYEDGQFYRVQGLTIGKCGNIYVVDSYQGRISVFDEDGVYISKFGEWGDQAGQLNVPMDIIFDSQERIIITSMNNGALELFSITDTLPCATIKSGSAMICSGESTDIEIGFTGTAPWTFTYSVDGLNSQSITTSHNPYILSVSESGHYEVSALSDAIYTGTCFTGSADITVSPVPPTSEINGDATICEGDTANVSVAFTGSAPWTFTYTTDGESPITATTVNNPYILKVIEAGHYELTELIGGGCTGTSFTGSANITLNVLPTAAITEGNVQIFIEHGETADLTVALTGTSPWNIIYTVDDLNPVTIESITESPYTFTVSEIGTYEIAEVSDVNCSNTFSLGYPELVYKSGIILPTSFMNNENFSICPDETTPVSIVFTGTAPWTFTYTIDTWIATTVFNTNKNPYIINAYNVGTYKVTALSDANYEGTKYTGSNVVLRNPLPNPEFDYTTNNLEVNFINNSLNAVSYHWDFGDGNTSSEINPVHQYQTSGEYTTSLTASNGICSDITITNIVKVIATSVETVEFENLLKIYPNPTSGLVTLEIINPTQSNIIVEIISINGSTIYSLKSRKQHNRETIDLSRFPNGLYLVKVILEEIIQTGKLIIRD